MRLDRFNPANIRVRDHGSGGGFPGGGGGKLGCGTIVIVLIAALVFGVDPGQMLGTIEQVQQNAPTQAERPAGRTAEEICSAIRDAKPELDCTEAPDLATALERARQSEDPILIAGSLFLVGEALAILSPQPAYEVSAQ